MMSVALGGFVRFLTLAILAHYSCLKDNIYPVHILQYMHQNTLTRARIQGMRLRQRYPSLLPFHRLET